VALVLEGERIFKPELEGDDADRRHIEWTS
jgi:hypothetical protein